jgi:glycosyltransferase involved in cell wall biosynthesis
VRVLFLNTATQPPLGADTWVHVQLMRDLDRSTTEVHTALVPNTPTASAIEGIPDLHVLAVDLGPELGGRSVTGKLQALVATLPAVPSLFRLARYVRRHRIDVIHTSDRPRDAFACVLLGRVTPATSLIHCHVSYADWMGRMLRWSLHHADALVAISQFVAGSLIAAGIDARRVHVVLNGIRRDSWQPGVGRTAARQLLGIDNDVPVVITACRLFPGKGPIELIKAVGVVRDTVPDVRLLVAGQDVTPGEEFTHELRALIADLDLARNVALLGRRDDLPSLMAAADVFAMPSTGEPFGLVFAEAMAMGLPVVGLDDGGTPEVVEHGRSGLLSRHGDIEGLAANLLTLIRNPELRAEMGEYGRRQVDVRFTTERAASEMAELYPLVVSPTANRS